MTEHRSNGEQTTSRSSPQHAYGEQEVKEYERKRYKGLDQRLVHRREMAILESLVERIAPESGVVLDVPCGYGRFSGLFRSRGLKLVSSDYSFAMVRRAMESRRASGPRKDWGIVADAKAGSPFREEAFPIVLCMRLWQHVPDAAERKAILDFFHEATSQWVILSYYQPSAVHGLQRRFRPRLKRLQMLTRPEFVAEAHESGFECAQVVPLMRGIHAQHVALLKKG